MLELKIPKLSPSFSLLKFNTQELQTMALVVSCDLIKIDITEIKISIELQNNYSKQHKIISDFKLSLFRGQNEKCLGHNQEAQCCHRTRV